MIHLLRCVSSVVSPRNTGTCCCYRTEVLFEMGLNQTQRNENLTIVGELKYKTWIQS